MCQVVNWFAGFGAWERFVVLSWISWWQNYRYFKHLLLFLTPVVQDHIPQIKRWHTFVDICQNANHWIFLSRCMGLNLIHIITKQEMGPKILTLSLSNMQISVARKHLLSCIQVFENINEITRNQNPRKNGNHIMRW